MATTKEESEKVRECAQKLADIEGVYGTPVFIMALSDWMLATGIQMSKYLNENK